MNLRLKLFLLLLTIEIVCAALGLLIYFLVWAQLWLLLVLLFVPGIAIGVIFFVHGALSPLRNALAAVSRLPFSPHVSLPLLRRRI